MIRKLPPFLLGATLVAPAATASAQTDHPWRVASPGDRWRVTGNIKPVAMGCHAPAMPGEDVMDLNMRGHFGQGMMRGLVKRRWMAMAWDPEAEGVRQLGGKSAGTQMRMLASWTPFTFNVLR